MARLDESGRYAAGALLGAGGMGEVHACTDLHIGRVVARKRLHNAPDAVDSVRRFIDEARLQGRLEHPAIVPVYDLGRDAEGAPFFTMKRVCGRTLAEVLAARSGRSEREWSTRRLLGALSTVALAIDYAHRQGVVHGDLKPQNVMLGRFGEVHVLDWGCATEVAHADDTDETQRDLLGFATLTSLRTRGDGASVVGTPGYLAPEQAHGVRGVPASDVYALGAMLFEIVAGEPLHRGTTRLALLVAVLERARQRPSERVPGLSVSPALEDLIERALDPEPTLRPSAREVATSIEALLDEEAAELGARRSAERHASEAKTNAHRALASGDERARRTALTNAARALALDPENPAATDVLARLLVEPPDELPPEARVEVRESERQIVRTMVDALSLRTRVWMAVIPLALALGVRSSVGAALIIGAIVVAAIALGIAQRAADLSANTRLGLLGIALFAIASMSGLFGPFMLVPVLAATTTTMFSVGFDRRQQAIAVAMGLATCFVPLALEACGVLAPSMTITEDAIVVHPRVVGFSPALTILLLVVGNAFAVPACVALMGRAWCAIDVARRRLALRTWQLECAVRQRQRVD
jgi:serine/threonine-protein kinase